MSATQNEPPPFLKAGEVATLLQLSRGTVYDMAKRGDLPAVWIGPTLRFSRRQIMELLERQAEAQAS